MSSQKRYLEAEELHQMRVRAGSPLLGEVKQRFKEPLGSWIPAHPGVGEHGCYEFIEPSATLWKWWLHW